MNCSLFSIAATRPGSSIDWAKKVGGVKWTFSIKLRPLDTPAQGRYEYFQRFILPAAEIEPTTEEFLAAIMTVAKRVLKDAENE